MAGIPLLHPAISVTQACHLNHIFPYTASSSDDKCGNALPGWRIFTSGNRLHGMYVTTSSASVDLIKDAFYTYGPLVTTLEVC